MYVQKGKRMRYSILAMSLIFWLSACDNVSSRQEISQPNQGGTSQEQENSVLNNKYSDLESFESAVLSYRDNLNAKQEIKCESPDILYLANQSWAYAVIKDRRVQKDNDGYRLVGESFTPTTGKLITTLNNRNWDGTDTKADNIDNYEIETAERIDDKTCKYIIAFTYDYYWGAQPDARFVSKGTGQVKLFFTPMLNGKMKVGFNAIYLNRETSSYKVGEIRK